MTDEEINEALVDNGLEGSSYLTGYNFSEAIVGYDESTGRIIYSYDLMVEYLTREEEMTQEEAMDYLNYNVIRAIPYMRPNPPIIAYPIIGL